MSLMNAGVDSTKDETYEELDRNIIIYIYVYIDQVGNDASDTVYQAPFPFLNGPLAIRIINCSHPTRPAYAACSKSSRFSSE